MNRMSIAEGLNENLEEQDAEKTQDAFPTVQHTPYNQRTNSLPGISACLLGKPPFLGKKIQGPPF